MTERIDVYRRGAAMVIKADDQSLSGLVITKLQVIDDPDYGMPQLQLTVAAEHIVVNVSIDEPDGDEAPPEPECTGAGLA